MTAHIDYETEFKKLSKSRVYPAYDGLKLTIQDDLSIFNRDRDQISFLLNSCKLPLKKPLKQYR